MAQLRTLAWLVAVPVCGAVLACSVPGEQAGKQGAKSMSEDPYFGRLGMQLIHCPPSSVERMKTAANGKHPPADPGATTPLLSAKSWVKVVLARPYGYPENTLFLPIRQENGLYDVVRASYNVHGQQIEIAQSLHVISITLRAVTPSATGSPARAEEVARRFLQVPESIHFEEAGAYEDGSWGRLPPSAGPPGWPYWMDELRWWSSGGDIGFLTLKAAGGPTKAVIGPSDGLNLHWFN